MTGRSARAEGLRRLLPFVLFGRLVVTVYADPLFFRRNFTGRDLAVYKEALQGFQFEEAFVPAATPARTDEDPDRVYPSEQAYL